MDVKIIRLLSLSLSLSLLPSPKPPVLAITCALVTGCQPGDGMFTVAVIPDTQNMVDFKHQKAEGFAHGRQCSWMDDIRGYFQSSK